MAEAEDCRYKSAVVMYRRTIIQSCVLVKSPRKILVHLGAFFIRVVSLAS